MYYEKSKIFYIFSLIFIPKSLKLSMKTHLVNWTSSLCAIRIQYRDCLVWFWITLRCHDWLFVLADHMMFLFIVHGGTSLGSSIQSDVRPDSRCRDDVTGTPYWGKKSLTILLTCWWSILDTNRTSVPNFLKLKSVFPQCWNLFLLIFVGSIWYI